MAKKTTNDETISTKGKYMVNILLDDSEKARKGEKMAEIDEDISVIEADFSKVKAEWSAKIKAKEKERAAISEVMRAGREKRQISCTEERDYAENRVRYTLNGKVLDERQMSTDEMQLRMEMRARQVTPPKTKRRFPGNGKDPADFKKAAAGDKDDDDAGNVVDIIRAETNGRTKRSAVDGPTS